MVVVGTGMIGLFVIQILRSKGCGKIIAIDLDVEKLKLAKKLGADYILSPLEDGLKEKIFALTSNRGSDHSFEVVGIDATVETAIESVRKGGTVTLIGNLSPFVRLPLQAVVTRQLKILGSCAICGEYQSALDMIARKQIDVKSLLSAEVPLSEGAFWLDKLYKKEAGLMKVILIP